MDETIMPNNVEKHIMSYKKLLGVLFSLITLTCLTVLAAQIDFGALSIFIALLIATIKATFVAMFFMHLRDESLLIKGTFLSTLTILSLCIALVLVDLIFR